MADEKKLKEKKPGEKPETKDPKDPKKGPKDQRDLPDDQKDPEDEDEQEDDEVMVPSGNRTLTGQRANDILTEPSPAQVPKPEDQTGMKLNNEVFDLTQRSRRQLHTMDDARTAKSELDKKHPGAVHEIRKGVSGKFYVSRVTSGGSHIVAGGG